YRTIGDYANADEEELAGYIKSTTFSANKARNIIKACKIIIAQYNGKIPRTMEGLISLPGVGRKTANTILINAYGIVVGIPVDTWVIKLGYRMGLSAQTDPEKIEQDLMKLIDKKYWRSITYVLKTHGRSVCKSTPICSTCAVNKLCPKNGVTDPK
ncbi:MAG: endonuclease III, partial [Candidatus Micrarchaeota archaeon]|nr:endonuclease III [Candidatus Micrarchaeota archaeon]